MWGASKTRRVVIVSLNETDMLSFFQWKPGQPLTMPVFESAEDRDGKRVPVPADAEILRVGHEPFNRAFTILLAHESFPEVPDGDMPPCLRTVYFRVRFVETKPEPACNFEDFNATPLPDCCCNPLPTELTLTFTDPDELIKLREENERLRTELTAANRESVQVVNDALIVVRRLEKELEVARQNGEQPSKFTVNDFLRQPGLLPDTPLIT